MQNPRLIGTIGGEGDQSPAITKMLGSGKLNSLDTRLEQFKLNNTTNQNELQIVLKEYSQLLEDYRTLKDAFKEQGRGEQFGKIEINEKARNPYVLVLIDGDGYVFNDELIKDKEEGGMRSARMLNEVVEKYLRDLPQAKDSRIIVRVYADLTGLSKQLAKSKLVGLEKRSLAPFAAAFTRAMSLFDFVDALDEEGTKFKIRETFKLAAEDSSCRHILYAACHDNSYLSQLVPYSGLRNKITLVQGAGFISEFHQFGLNVTQFPTIFRWSGLLPATPSSKIQTASTTVRTGSPLKTKFPTKYGSKQPAIGNGNGWRDYAYSMKDTYDTDDISLDSFPSGNGVGWTTKPEGGKKNQALCKYFQKGFCRFGNKCSFQHVPNSMGSPDQQSKSINIDRSNISSLLPTATVPGFIPLNASNQRIDPYIRAPSQGEWAIYNARFHRQKPCNDHYLQGNCMRLSCPYDHTPLEPESRHCLEYVLKCSPCPRKGGCRASDCFYGHLCQKDECMGQMKGCRMKAEQHNTDPKLASMVRAEEDMVHEDHMGIEGGVTAMW